MFESILLLLRNTKIDLNATCDLKYGRNEIIRSCGCRIMHQGIFTSRSTVVLLILHYYNNVYNRFCF